MYPVYNYVDPYPQPLPHQRNHCPHPHQYNPSWEMIAPHVRVDQSESPTTFKPWLCGGNFSYPHPSDCHGSCNHGYPSGYYSFRPPHSHLPPHPPMYYYGPNPPYPEAYPPYFIPPPYPVDQAWYEYDKNMSRDSCCGCPNHTCNRKADSNVKIEEEKPEVERKDDDSSPRLTKLQNFPYPIIWMPPGYMKDKESTKPSESESKLRNGWLPIDLNNLKSLRKGGDEKRAQSQQTEEKKPHLEWPIIWFPGYDKPEEVEKEDVKDIGASPKVGEDHPSNFKIIPVKLLKNENYGDKPEVVEDTSGLAVEKERETKPKSIQVTQIEDNGLKMHPEKTAQKPLPPQDKENGEKKSSENTAKKSSKLPPVCLRVNPLPKKKNGNGTSRSPSPPAAKDRAQLDLKKQESVIDTAAKGGQTKKEIKVVGIEDNACQTSQAENKQMEGNGSRVFKLEEIPRAQVVDDNKEKSQESRNQIEKKDKATLHFTEEPSDGPELDARNQGSKGPKGDAETKEVKKAAKRKILPNAEAAVIIQSAYRGYEVRKWEPLKKLKQIAKIREQVENIREQIYRLETCAKLPDEKQPVFISETIMTLLLQLDTIQGLNPIVREIRKSVAKELICLQEKLDSLASQNSGKARDLSTAKPCDDHCESAEDNSLTPSEPVSVLVKLDEPLIDEDATANASQVDRTIETATVGRELPLVEESDPKQEEFLRQPVTAEHETSGSGIEVPMEELDGIHQLKDEKEDSMEDTLLGSLPTEEAHDSVAENSLEASLLLEEREVPSKLEEESTTPLSVKDASVELPMESSLADVEPSSMIEESAEVLSVEDKCPDSTVEMVKAPEMAEEKVEIDLEMDKASEMGVEQVQTRPIMIDEFVASEVSSEKNREIEFSTEDPTPWSMQESLMEAKGSPENSENEMLFSQSEFDIVDEAAMPEPASERNDVLIESGSSNERDSDTKVADENLQLEEKGKHGNPSMELKATEDVTTEFPDEEKWADPQSDTSSTPNGETVTEVETLPPPSISDSDTDHTRDTKHAPDAMNLVDENKKLKETLEKLMETGRRQLTVISDLNGRVRDLERKLAKKKKLKMRRSKGIGSSCVNAVSNPLKDRATAAPII